MVLIFRPTQFSGFAHAANRGFHVHCLKVVFHCYFRFLEVSQWRDLEICFRWPSGDHGFLSRPKLARDSRLFIVQTLLCFHRRDSCSCPRERLCLGFLGEIVSCVLRSDCILFSEERLCIVFGIVYCVQSRYRVLLKEIRFSDQRRDCLMCSQESLCPMFIGETVSMLPCLSCDSLKASCYHSHAALTN